MSRASSRSSALALRSCAGASTISLASSRLRLPLLRARRARLATTGGQAGAPAPAAQLIDELRREDSGYAQGGSGFTFEGQGMILSAPGTEAFKQDFAKWEELRKQATAALERAESSLSKKLQAQESRDRLAAGVDDTPPAAYRQQVESYFKALATKPKP